MNGLQVFRRHDVFVVYFQFDVAFLILHDISPAAHLHTSAPVGRSIQLIQTQVTFSGNRHTQGTVTEHLYPHQFAHRTLNLLFLDSFIDFPYLFQVQFTRQYHYIGKLRIELQCLHVTDVQLGRKVYFLPHLIAVSHHRYIGGNHRADTGFLGRIDNPTHQFQVFIINNGVDGEVTLHSVFVTDTGYLPQIIDGKRAG